MVDGYSSAGDNLTEIDIIEDTIMIWVKYDSYIHDIYIGFVVIAGTKLTRTNRKEERSGEFSLQSNGLAYAFL